MIPDEATLRRRPALVRWGIAALTFAVALLARAGLHDTLPPGFPYLTFFPAVFITAMLAGTGPATVVAVLSGFTAWYFFMPPFGSLTLDYANAVALMFYALIAGTAILIIDSAQRALRDLRGERERSAELAHSRKLMFQELQHRVSNNLATVAGLLKIQSRTLADPDARRALEVSVARIALIARMQRMLHDPASQQVDFGRFLREVSTDLLETSGLAGQVACDVRAEPVMIGSGQSVPLALIATEFIANALEHAFHDDRKGRLSIRLQPDGDEASLSVTDDGPGIPEAFEAEADKSLGLAIARQFASQLNGSLAIEAAPGGGTQARLRFRPDLAEAIAAH